MGCAPPFSAPPFRDLSPSSLRNKLSRPDVCADTQLHRLSTESLIYTYSDNGGTPRDLVAFARSGQCLVAAAGNWTKLQACLDDLGHASYPLSTPLPPMSPFPNRILAYHLCLGMVTEPKLVRICLRVTGEGYRSSGIPPQNAQD